MSAEHQDSIADLKNRSDETVVRIWLADRGLIAVQRELMDEVVHHWGVTLHIVYDAHTDRYIRLGVK